MAEFKRREHDRALMHRSSSFKLHRDVDYQDAHYQSWLDRLAHGQQVDPDQVICLFLTSEEYQRRFGSVITRNNSECRSR